jgi:hypothetical protein
MTSATQRLGIVVFLTVLAGRANADVVYDAAKDFSVVNGNPNGVWTYGYSLTLGGPLILNNNSGTNFQGSGIQFWNTNIAANDPFVGYNPTSQLITLGPIQVQPGQLFFHPGPNDEFETVRFRAPAAGGSFQLVTGFVGVDTTGTTTDVHVLLNGVSQFSGLINGFGSKQAYSTTLTLRAGDILDFAVGYGSDGNFLDDSTGLSAVISPTAVPEPSTLTLAAVASGAMVMRWLRGRRCRKKAA